MEEERERIENDPNVSINDDTGDTGIKSNSQDNQKGFAQVVQIRSSSCFLSINPENSRAFQMLTNDDVLAMQFDSFEVGESFYHKYASAVGFIVRKDDISRNKKGEIVMRRWVCNREGFRQRKYLENVNRRRDPRPSTRVNCPAAFRISLDRVTHKWLVKEFVAEHTHELAPTCKSHLQIDPAEPMIEVDKVKENAVINVEAQPSQVMDYLAKQVGDCDRVGMGRQDLQNSLDAHCRAEITISNVETALAYLSAKKDADPGLFYETKIVEGRLASFFLADSVSQLDYGCFGDVMAVYRTNAYKMHFVILGGLNHHNQTSVFGCALLDDETVEAYIWLFQTFLHVMQGNMPTSVVTDDHKAVSKAIQHVLPQSRHRLCTWHLERNAHFNVNDASFVSYFKVCMLEILSQDDFELKWKEMVDKYKLSGNQWICKMYKKRHRWAEAYLRGHFWAGLRSTRVCEGINEHLCRFSPHKLKLYQFISQYSRAVDVIRCNEAKAEYDATYVQFALSTPLVKIEKHAADVFTRESYKRFLSEMRLETLLFVLNKVEGSDYRIYTLGNYEHRNLVYEVMFEPSGPSLRCSCLNFETSGFPCGHAIHIIKSERLEEIPQNLIHPRWTKSAKSRAQFRQHALPAVSGDVIMRMVRHGALLSSFSSLCYLGSKSDQAYNILCCELRKIKHKIEEHSAIGNASNSGALSTPTIEKDVNPVSKIATSKSNQLCNGDKRRKTQRERQSRNVEHIQHGCPNLVNATISVVDSNPVVVHDTSDTSSDSELEQSPRVDQGRGPFPSTHASHRPTGVEARGPMLAFRGGAPIRHAVDQQLTIV